MWCGLCGSSLSVSEEVVSVFIKIFQLKKSKDEDEDEDAYSTASSSCDSDGEDAPPGDPPADLRG